MKKDFLRETASYIAVGILSTAVSFAIMFLFTTVFEFEYTPSSIVSFILSSPIGFTLNRKFTFKAGALPVKKTLPRYYMIVIPCFLLSFLVLKPGFDWLINALRLPWPVKYQTYAKQILANGVYIVINYLGQKFFAFKKDKPAQGTD